MSIAAIFLLAGALAALPPGPGPRPQPPRPGAQGQPGQNQRPGQEADREPARLNETRIAIRIGEAVGTIKPLLGVNAGPAPSGEAGNADLTREYAWAGINAVRTQDFYGPLDLSVMYPDLKADPAETGSYRFAASDQAFLAITRAGLKVYLRLGDSWNNVRVPQNAAERANYVRAAVEVVGHYCGLAADRIEYVEIGNEPDNRRFWPAKYEDFFPFFTETFERLKRLYPGLKIGGPGFVVSSYKIPSERVKVARFLEYLGRQKIKPDFISFHLYSNDPGEYFDIVSFYRQAAAKAGLDRAELQITEWNTEGGGATMRTGRKAAPYVTACWTALQEAGVDASYLFRGNDTNENMPEFYGIFFADGRRKPAANAFHLWSRMARFRHRLKVTTGDALLDATPGKTGVLKPLWILAGRDDAGQVALLISNLGDQAFTCDLSLPPGVTGARILEIADPGQGLRELETKGGELTISPLSVQFVTLNPSR